MIKFIHCGDIHLDTPFTGLGNVNERLQNHLLQANKESFENIIRTAIKEKVDFVLISGDLFDNASRSLESQLRCKRYFEELDKFDIKVFIVGGNHDPLTEPFKVTWPQNTHYFSINGETINIKINREDVYIHGISFDSDKVERNLSSQLPQAVSGGINIGLLHCDVGSNINHYSSCSLTDLRSKNYDYFALGHIHKGEILSANPYIVYCGCHQGKSIKEVGEKGCYLVEFNQGKIDIKFYKTNTVQWMIEELDIAGLGEEQLFTTLQNRISAIEESFQGKCVIVRVILTGRGKLNSLKDIEIQQIISELNESLAFNNKFVWVESIQKETLPELDFKKIQEQDPFLKELISVVETVQQDSTSIEELFSSMDILSKINIRKISGDIDKQKVLKDAQNLLLSMLSRGE